MRAELPSPAGSPTVIQATVPNAANGEPSFRFYPVSIVREKNGGGGLVCQHNRHHAPHLLNDPVQLPCGHRFCKVTCWEPNLFLQRQLCRRSEALCPDPDCRVMCELKQIFSDECAVLESNGLAVHCLNRANGCTWSGNLATLKKDHIHRCTFARVQPCRPDAANLQVLVTMLHNVLTEQGNQQDQMRVFQCLIRQCQEQIRLLIKSSGMTEADMAKFEKVEERVAKIERGLEAELKFCKYHLALCQEQLDDIFPQLQSLETTVRNKPAEICHNGTYLWKITNFHQYVARSTTLGLVYASLPFYTEKYGYKLRAKIYINDRKVLGQDDILGVSVMILQGDYDNILPWPFNKGIELMLMDQSALQDHYNLNFRCDFRNNSACYQKPTSSFSNPESKIYTISRSKLQETDHNEKKYVSVDGQLFLQFSVPDSRH